MGAIYVGASVYAVIVDGCETAAVEKSDAKLVRGRTTDTDDDEWGSIMMRATADNEHVEADQPKALAPSGGIGVPGLTLQRKCACGAEKGTAGECERCRSNALSLQRSAMSAREPLKGPPIRGGGPCSSGQSLDQSARDLFGPRFGHDFSQMRVYSDARAAESDRGLNALAYAEGGDIVFGDGIHDIGTALGRELLAHERTHVVQRGGGRGPRPPSIFAETGREGEGVAAATAEPVLARSAVILDSVSASSSRGRAADGELARSPAGHIASSRSGHGRDPAVTYADDENSTISANGSEARVSADSDQEDEGDGESLTEEPEQVEGPAAEGVDEVGQGVGPYDAATKDDGLSGSCPNRTSVSSRKQDETTEVLKRGTDLSGIPIKTYGKLISTMKVHPGRKNWDGTQIVETLKTTSNTCPPEFSVDWCGGDSTFTVGAAADPFPAKRNRFYDFHFTSHWLSLLHARSQNPKGLKKCKVVCEQEYHCGGKVIGNYIITRTFKRRTLDKKEHVTFVHTTKRAKYL